MTEGGEAGFSPAPRLLAATAWLAAAALLAPLAIPLATGRVFTGYDLGWFHLPIRHLYREALRHGDSILWSPSIYSGIYLHGEGQGGFYHPLHLVLYRGLPLDVAFNLEMLSSYVIGFAGMWLLLRRLSCSSAASAFGAMLFAFSGFNLLHLSHLNMVAVAMHIPWMLVAVHVLLTAAGRREQAAGFIGVAIVLASQLLLGFPQFLWMTMLAAAAFAWYAGSRRTWRTNGALLAGAAACGVIMGAAQLIPTIDAAAASGRVTMPEGFWLTFSLHPWNLVQLWAPYVFAMRIYARPEEFFLHEFGAYTGAFCTLAAALAIAMRRDLTRRRLTIGAVMFAAAMLVFALGRYGGVYPWLAVVPGLTRFRAPARHLVLVHLALAVVGGLVFDDLMKAPPSRRVPWRRMWPLALVAALSIATTATGAVLAGSPWAAARGMTLSPGWSGALGPAFIGADVLFIVLAARGRRWALVPLVVITAVDLKISGERYVWGEAPVRPYSLVPARGIPPGSRPGDYVYAPVHPPDIDRFVLHGYRLSNSYTGLPPAVTIQPHELVSRRLAGVRWAATDQGWVELTDSMPRVRLVAEARTSANIEADVQRIDIGRTALVDNALPPLDAGAGAARVVIDRPGHLIVETAAPGMQLLVLTERFHPGWRASEDGREIAVRRVYGDYLGCVVSGGAHRITLAFDPSSARWGLWLSVAGVALTCAAFVIIGRTP